MTDRVLYIVSCGAPLAARIGDGIRASREHGWLPVLIPTDASQAWLEGQDLSGATVLSGHRAPGADRQAAKPDAVTVAPLTFNTLNAWANGNANTYALTTLCASLGARVPTVAVPFAKDDLTGHPAWLASLAVLRYAGVTIVDPQSGASNAVDPIASGTGEQVTAAFQWSWVLDQLG